MKQSSSKNKHAETESVYSKAKGGVKKHEKNDILYAMPAKPLDFSFKEVKMMEDLRKMEPRNGVRRPVSLIEKEENEKNENSSGNRYDKHSNGYTFEDELSEKLEKKPKKEQKERESDVIEGRIHAEKVVENKGKIIKKEEEIVEAPKKKVKYLTYNNSVILHSNKIKSLEKIHSVFNEILPDVDFLIGKSRSKIELIQWIDVSHNHLTEIHPDILNLPYLKILYCHANFIEEIKSVAVLSKCKSLLNLTLHGNPIEHVKGYRQYIIELVPFLEKLDYTLVSEKELDIIYHKGSRYGEKRDKSGKVISYPKIDEEVLKRMKKPKDEENDKKDDN